MYYAKITDYAEELLDHVDHKLPGWPERVRLMQAKGGDAKGSSSAAKALRAVFLPMDASMPLSSQATIDAIVGHRYGPLAMVEVEGLGRGQRRKARDRHARRAFGAIRLQWIALALVLLAQVDDQSREEQPERVEHQLCHVDVLGNRTSLKQHRSHLRVGS